MTRHQNSGQRNHQTADPKANGSVFLLFPTAHFLKTILTSRTFGTFVFAPTHKANASAKAKEPKLPPHKMTFVPRTSIFLRILTSYNSIIA